MSERYEDILNQSWEVIPEAKLLPVGSYLLKLRNVTFLAPKQEGQNGRVLFFYVPKEPMDDVDVAEIEALGADYDIGENQVVFTKWIENNRDWQAVKQHIAKHGVEIDPKLSLADTFKAARNSEVIAYLDQRTFTRADGETVTENNPTQFSPVE
jgi:hypothetical protein